MIEEDNKEEENVEINLRQDQHCFILGNQMLCNFVIRNGKVIRPVNSKFIAFPVYFRLKKKEKEKAQLSASSNVLIQ